MITLYYIEGIDRENIPYVYPAYKTQITISDYLREHEVATIPNSYYPPYYRNIISISSEDFTGNFLETSINYLGIVFGNKTYYYFIDSIEYVNEDLYKLHVTMDVIMTYINDIKIHGGIIERKFIDRYDSNDKFNRNYLRENVSKGSFYVKKKEYLNNLIDYKQDDYTSVRGKEYIKGWYVFKFTSLPNNYVNTKRYNPRVYINKSYYQSQYVYSIFPLLDFSKVGSKEVHIKVGVNDTSDNVITTEEVIKQLCSEPTCVECKFVPLYIFDFRLDIIQVEGSTQSYYRFTTSSGLDFWQDLKDSNKWWGFCPSVFANTELYYTIPLYLTKNINKGQLFNASMCPVLMDENYKRYYYGDGDIKSTFETYLLTGGNLRFNYVPNIDSGSRAYYISGNSIYDITDNNEYGYKDVFYSLQINENYISCDLINDAWKTWKAYNGATLPLVLGKGIYESAKFGVEMYSNYKLPMELLKINSRDRRYKDIVLNKSGVKKSNKLNIDAQESILEGIDNVSKIPGRYDNILNARLEPPSVKTTGTIGSFIMSETSNIRYEMHEVNDINQCAQYYHRNGYLVDEYINEVDNIFDYVSTRYYYNILKMRDVDISLVNSPASTEIIELISERLENGIRLWNCDEHNTFVEIGNYTYDNVERSYLNE